MSSIRRDGKRLTQRHNGREAELGYIDYDKSVGRYVLWLKDSRDLFDIGRGYVRGDEYPTLGVAKAQTVMSPSANLMHLLWITGLAQEAQSVAG